MATLVNSSTFAKMAGVTTSAIAQAIKRGAVVAIRGNIDIDDPANRKYLEAKERREAAQHRAKHNKRPGRPRKNPTTSLPDAPQEAPAFEGPTPGTKEYFSTLKLKAQTENIQIQMAERLGTLVPREEVRDVLSKLASVLSSQLITMGVRVAVDMAGIFGSTDQKLINQARAFIEDDVAKVIESAKRAIEDEFK